MDRSTVLESGEEEIRVSDAGNAETVEYFKSGRTESQGEETESEVTYSISERSNYLQIPYGFQSRGSYKHASKNCEIVGVTHNSRFRQFVFLDSRGITSWSYESVYNTVTRHLNYPSYQFNVLRLIIFSRKFNVYFALSKEYVLKVFNLNFHEVFSVAAEMHSVLCMVFNHVKDELITGGTGGMKFWTFGELDKDRKKAWDRDSRPMANYGLVLRASYPDMGGSWVKQVDLDEPMQRLYCLSERNVVAYDMEGNLLFQILDAHRGPVTGCVYSKACNFLVTVGNDCDVNVWSRAKSGGKVHTFSGHSKAITKILLHPENSALVITAAMDGIIKVNSLDFMEEVYSIPVFSEGIYWMNIVSPKLLYCCSNRFIEVFSLNHLCDFWASSRCSVTSLSLVTCKGKSTRVMAVGNDSSVRLISRKRQNLSTVLPPPLISPLNMVKDVAYNREFNMMYLLIDEREIWVYYTRTNPATRVESWKLDFIENIHSQHSQDALQKSRASSPWLSEGNRFPSPESPSLGPSSFPPLDASGRESVLSTRKEKVLITCLGILYSPILMTSLEGDACPDTTHFLMAGTQDGRVLFLHMFWQGLKYHQLQANKDAVLQVYHDQDNNTLVTKCRCSKIVILIWSLPLLLLTKRIDCDADMTCFTRMNNIMLCGHQSGYLHLHSLSVDNGEFREDKEERAAGTSRPPPKDHQSCINSVDSNSNLEIFCSVSGDGIIKIWDGNKILLREIIMNETLTVASFLNTQGDILIGFKQHIFIIPNEKVCPVKDGLLLDGRSDSIDDEAFETESDIYEDPSVRFESKKILQPDPTNMENYLVPFPNLQLKTSWFMEGRPPPDLEPQKQQEDEESISLMSDSLSLAPTEVYGSLSSTPRRMSLASSVTMSERRTSTELWDLPEFGNSPVSSPPRTPPPEPTPPSTPPPEVESDEDSSGSEEKKESQNTEDQPCERCENENKKEKKKGPVIPSFRREKGRMGNIAINSRSLRSGFGGPGYAAPVSKKLIEQRPEPKSFKPRRIPKPIVKKAKKPKEKGEEEEEAKKEKDEKETETIENEPGEAEEEKQKTEDTVKVNGDDDNGDDEDGVPAHRTPNVVTMPTREQTPLMRQETVSPKRVSNASPPEQLPSRSAKNEEQMRVREKGKDAAEPQKTTSYSPPQRTAEDSTSKAVSSGEDLAADNEDENMLDQDNETKGERENEEGAPVEGDKPGKHDSPEPRDPQLVTFIDPDTGKVLQRPLNEVPDDAEILEDYDDDNELEGINEYTSPPAEHLTSSRRSKRSDRGRKSVTFSSEHIRTSQANRPFPSLYTSGRDSPTLRSRNAGLVFKETVVPVYGNERPGDPLRKTSKSSSGVSPLTIFALARSRQEHTPKSTNVRTWSADGRYKQKHGTSENFSLRTDEVNQGDFDLNDDDLLRLIDTVGLQTGAEGHETPGSLRPPSVRKQGSTLMRWCIQALQKTDREVLFPPKPTRPGSSPSVATSKATKKVEGAPKGNTLYLSKKDDQKRPQTADTVRSNTTSHEEYSMFPYENTSLNKATEQTKTRDRKSVTPARMNAWKHVSSDEDEDFLDAYQAMRSSVGPRDADKDYVKDLISRGSFGSERFSNSRDIPRLDTSDYSGNWQYRVLERAHRLKQQRLERQKSATERRQALDNKHKERWKNSSHLEYAQEQPPKPDPVLEFITPPPAIGRKTSPSPPLSQTEIRKLKEQELSNERPFRLTLNSQPGGVLYTPLVKSLMDLKTGDHHVSDVANVLPKPPPSASIPSKCSRYVLVAQPDIKQPRPQATAVEETLLMLRFPKSRVRRRHASATIPKLHSNRNVRAKTSLQM